MKLIEEYLDTIAFNASVLKIDDVDPCVDFKTFEEEYIKTYSPMYVYSRIPIENLNSIHYLEDNGFNFVETQFKMTKRLSHLEDMTPFEDNYTHVKITDISELPTIYNLSDEILKVDRVYLDEKIDKKIAQKRYHLYIEKSFKSDDEVLFKVIHKPSKKIIGFHTYKILDSKNILFFIGGIIPEFWGTGASFADEYLLLNNLYSQGFKKITTHISASNYNNINFELRTIGFKPKQTYVILRKIY